MLTRYMVTKAPDELEHGISQITEYGNMRQV